MHKRSLLKKVSRLKLIGLLCLLFVSSSSVVASQCDQLSDSGVTQQTIDSLSPFSLEHATSRIDEKANKACASSGGAAILTLSVADSISQKYSTPIHQVSACICCNDDATCQAAKKNSPYQQALLKKLSDALAAEQALLKKLSDALTAVEHFSLPNEVSGCQLPTMPKVRYTNETDYLEKWHSSAHYSLSNCLQKEINRNYEAFETLISKKLGGSTSWVAFDVNNQPTTWTEENSLFNWEVSESCNNPCKDKLQSLHKKIPYNAQQKLQKFNRSWDDFVDYKVKPAIDEWWEDELEYQRQEAEKNRKAPEIVYESNDMDDFVNALSQAHEESFLKPQREKARRQAAEMSILADQIQRSNANKSYGSSSRQQGQSSSCGGPPSGKFCAPDTPKPCNHCSEYQPWKDRWDAKCAARIAENRAKKEAWDRNCASTRNTPVLTKQK